MIPAPTHNMSYADLRRKFSQLSYYDLLVFALTFFFIGLGIAQFVSNRNLWGDEAVIARNVLMRNFWQLLRPLDYDQMAPLLFLEMEELFSQIIANFGYALRFFPLLCFIGTFVGFVKVCKILVKNPLLTLFALSILGWNYRIIFYSVEIKQYMGEVLVTTWLLYFLLKPYQTESRKITTLSIVGCISIFLSSVAPILLLSAGAYLLIDYYQSKKDSFDVVLTPSLWWSRTFVLNYFIIYFKNTNPKTHKLHWIKNYGFMPGEDFASMIRFISAKKEEVFAVFN